MNPWSPANIRRMAVFACAGAALPRAMGQEESSVPPVIASMLGFGSPEDQIAEIAQKAESTGDWRYGMGKLARIAGIAREAGDHTAWVEAELAWVKLAASEGEEADLDDALQELVSRARDWGLGRQEAEVFTFWAERLESEGEWLMALRALDGAAQAALGDRLVNPALRAMTGMSRLCRENDHPWRLQQVWVRIGQVEQELSESIDDSARGLIEEERAAAAPMLAGLMPVQPATPRIDLQPSQAAVRVSAPHGEVARARFFLTNETVRTVSGTLQVAARTGSVKTWETGRSGHWLTLGPRTSKQVAPSTRALSLRPGERVSVYVEREQPSPQESVNITWSAPGGVARATGEFSFAGKQPLTAVVNAGSFNVRPGWGVPLYHEVNFRGPGVSVEDFQFQSNVPCRLEVFDVDGGKYPAVDAGKLIAVDAEGDGYFTSSDDLVTGDNNSDGTPDILIGDRSRSLEIFAWPLAPLPDGEEVTISARLRRPGDPAAWRTDAEDTLAPAGRKQ